MSAEAITIANFDLLNGSIQNIYAIGATPEGGATIPDMSAAFGHSLDEVPNEQNLGDLIGAVGPAKELQDNIAAARGVLGTTRDARERLVGWIEESELLVPVERAYMRPDLALPEGPVVGVMKSAVARWMARRAEVILSMGSESDAAGIAGYFHSVVLAAGNRPMKPTEGEDVREGMVEADYIEEIVVPKLGDFGINAEVVRVDDNRGDVVVDAAAIAILSDPSRRDLPIAMASNAGAWVQDGGQLRRALRRVHGNENFDAAGDQLYVMSDAIDVGYTGTESPTTHQNPFSAVGIIARAVQEMTRHMASAR